MNEFGKSSGTPKWLIRKQVRAPRKVLLDTIITSEHATALLKHHSVNFKSSQVSIVFLYLQLELCSVVGKKVPSRLFMARHFTITDQSQSNR